MINILAKFMWCIARVDSRQYRQNSTELAPESFWVGVEVPLEKEYIFNVEEILVAQTGSGNMDVPKPIYTAKALQFCLDKLGEFLHDPDEVSPDDFKQEPADDWGETETKKEKIDWSDNAEPSPQAKEVEEIWDGDDDGDPDEKWNDKEESWE